MSSFQLIYFGFLSYIYGLNLIYHVVIIVLVEKIAPKLRHTHLNPYDAMRSAHYSGHSYDYLRMRFKLFLMHSIFSDGRERDYYSTNYQY